MARQAVWKQVALREANELWVDLHDEGYPIEQLNDYHWRYKNVNIWPSSKKYQEQGGDVRHYEDLAELIKSIK